jgi:uncharacterized protein YecT (DUF1311 family)
MQTLLASLFIAFLFADTSAFAQDSAEGRTECSTKPSHPEMRACLQSKVKASSNELRQAENEMRKALKASDQEPADIKRSNIKFNSSIKQFIRFRRQHCEFIASLSFGGNGQGDLRMSCIFELNAKRIIQIQQASTLLQ